MSALDHKPIFATARSTVAFYFDSSSFITLSALLPTLASAASIFSVGLPSRLRQRRARSLVETSIVFRAGFGLEVIMIGFRLIETKS